MSVVILLFKMNYGYQTIVMSALLQNINILYVHKDSAYFGGLLGLVSCDHLTSSF